MHTHPKHKSNGEQVNERPVEFQHDLIPLPVAARVVYARIYAEDTPSRGESFLLERLDGAAAAIAGTTQLYAYQPAQPSAFRWLRHDELRGGIFHHGGHELHFNDGRESLRNLAVARADLDHVLSLLGENPAGALLNSGYSDDRSVST